MNEDENIESLRQQDALILAQLIYDIYQDKKLRQKGL